MDRDALEQVFPDLQSVNYEITSVQDSRYNCVAWAAGVMTAWWWPPVPFDIGYFWPPGVTADRSVHSFVEAFGTLGYSECDHGSWEAGREKIALFALDDLVTHAARQLADGRWTSKLGVQEDIMHALEGLEGNIYGRVVQFLVRPAS